MDSDSLRVHRMITEIHTDVVEAKDNLLKVKIDQADPLTPLSLLVTRSCYPHYTTDTNSNGREKSERQNIFPNMMVHIM